MDIILLFGVLLTLFTLVTIKKVKAETFPQKFVHIGLLVVGVIFLIIFTIQFIIFQ
ncbi:hypothetical protein BN1058_00125 [Paraliobacillus sp. PM-2]|uniref:hypothetical protein n=1 Tax=Paraliobacillus sp. PM-2 TaxID=1462524 RepID=UPI00061C2632|nr:hypothetical protein [Paraliobacillus sp. PM-2]CQR45885.1 hypothetical protein BN1058_00125 [Paraliobacillus sp. PM-2]